MLLGLKPYSRDDKIKPLSSVTVMLIVSEETGVGEMELLVVKVGGVPESLNG